jgi:hypothetical protein
MSAASLMPVRGGEGGDGDEPGEAGGDVVDAGGDAGEPRVDAAQDGGGLLGAAEVVT